MGGLGERVAFIGLAAVGATVWLPGAAVSSTMSSASSIQPSGTRHGRDVANCRCEESVSSRGDEWGRPA